MTSEYAVFCGLDVGKESHHACALDPGVTRRSGISIRGEHPPRSGNKHLKRALFLAAFAALRDPVSRAYYYRKRAEGKRHNAALICLARRRCDVLYAMLKNQQLYEARLPAAA